MHLDLDYLKSFYENRKIRVVLKILILVLTLFVIATYGWMLYVNFDEIGKYFYRINLPLFIFAIIFSFGVALIVGKRLQIMVKIVTNSNISFKDSLKILFSANSLGHVTPANLGEFSKIEFIRNKTGCSRKKCLIVPLSERILDVAILAVFAFATNIIMLCFFLLLTSIIATYSMYKKIVNNKFGIIKIVLLSIVHKIGIVFSLMFIIYSLDVNIGFVQASNILGVSLLAGIISYLPGGWGTREFSMGFLLQGAITNIGIALLIPLLYALMLGIMIIVGFVVFYKSIKIDNSKATKK
ncbi:MAG: flippase-like domain-containing protein [Nanoarchaeota archaeon]|nr:flippase-like domain-containing protein [Nanoarchaeota archaeon]MBU2520552.1 flippase-like domain-containing protein [Nanoarchaeota archaeon]